MTFLLNFVHFEAIFAYSETDFANFETKIPDRCGRIWDGGQNNAVEKTQIKFVFLLAYSYLCSTINHKC